MMIRALHFSHVKHLIRAIYRSLDTTDDIEHVMVDSADDVARRLRNEEFDVVLVRWNSIRHWWSLETSLATPITLPRIVVNPFDFRWTNQYAIDLGFDGLVQEDRTRPVSHYVDQVRRAIDGATTRGSRAPVDPSILEEMVSLDHLSGGEEVNLEIAGLVALGLPIRDIASAVGLSEKTVRNRTSDMLRRAGVINRTQLGLIYLFWRYEEVLQQEGRPRL